MFEPGTVIAGKYVIERTLGEGGMGVVVQARHQQLDQKVALKFMHASSELPPDAVTRFTREARAVAKLRGENVARVLDVDTLPDGTPYIVMEYLEGRDLSDHLDETVVSPAEAVDYVLQACVGLAEAHAQGIVHRDLKPANLFLTSAPDGAPLVKILDFGISKLRSEEDPATSTTRTGTVMGSPLYMPPEQARSAKDVDARADIWSLGAVLYKLLTRKPPFVADNVADLFADILYKPHVPASTHANVPTGLDAVLDRCLAKQPADRFANLAELAVALGPYASADGPSLIGRVLRLTGDPRAPQPSLHQISDSDLKATVPDPHVAGGSTESPLSVTNQKKPARAFWALGVGVLGALAVGTVLVLRSRTPEPEPAPAAPAVAAESPEPVVAPTPTRAVSIAKEPDAAAPIASEKPPAPKPVAAPRERPKPAPPPPPKPTAPADPFGTMQ